MSFNPLRDVTDHSLPVFLSLGAGVQSSALALMATHGEVTPMPTAAIFADTQAEPRAVYDWLDRLEKDVAFPVYRVTEGSLTDTIAMKRPIGRFRKVDIPAFVKLTDGTMGGLINRSCTRDFKITPIRRRVRELLGISRKKSPKHVIAVQWMGISVDEWLRAKEGREPWLQNRWPLIDMKISRNGCIRWLRQHGYPEPPKSACIYCPFHSNTEWTKLTESELAEAIEVDDRLRKFPSSEYRTTGSLFLHRSGIPLRDRPFVSNKVGQHDLFGDECAGVCGV